MHSFQNAAQSIVYTIKFGCFWTPLAVTGLGVLLVSNAFACFHAKSSARLWPLDFEVELIFTSGFGARKPFKLCLFSLFIFATGEHRATFLASHAVESGSVDVIYRSLFATIALLQP